MRRIVLGVVAGLLVAHAAPAAPPNPPVPNRPDHLYQPVPPKTADATGLAVVVHGWVSGPSYASYTNLQRDLKTRLGASWDVWNFDWHYNANYDGKLWSDAQEAMAEIHGQQLARIILDQAAVTGGYQQVQLLGLSMGSRVIDQAGKVLRQAAPSLPVQLTFFDAWAPHGTHMTYGRSATWSDHYIYVGDTAGNVPNWNTDRTFACARNFDVTAYGQANPAYAGHSGPIVWYDKTVNEYDPATPRDYGFDLSRGVNAPGWGRTPASRWATQMRVVLNHNGVATSTTPVPGSARFHPQPIDPQQAFHAKGGTATVAAGQLQLSSTNSSAGWVELTIDAPAAGVNCLEFRFQFLSGGNGAMLSVFIDNKLVTLQQKEYALADKQWAYDLILDPRDDGVVLTGAHTLAFRLDSMHSAGASSVWVGDITLSQLNAPEPATLMLLVGLSGVALRRPRRNPARTAPPTHSAGTARPAGTAQDGPRQPPSPPTPG